VAPISWLFAHHAGDGAMDWLENHLDDFDDGTGGMMMVALNGHYDGAELTDEERHIVNVLRERPHSLAELTQRIGHVAWEFLPLGRLEEHHAIQRCGLTPTDLLHARGDVTLWDSAAATRMGELTARALGKAADAFGAEVLEQVVRKMAVELLKKQLAEETEADELDESPTAMTLVENLLDGGNGEYRVRVQLKRPVIGIGAPVHFFLPQAAAMLETECIIPHDADVANAIGAITSSVRIVRGAEVAPNDAGGYSVHGLPGHPMFAELEEATQYATAELVGIVREMAYQAGTSQMDVEVTVDDHVAAMAEEGRLFVGRRVEARLTGRPDLVRLSNECPA